MYVKSGGNVYSVLYLCLLGLPGIYISGKGIKKEHSLRKVIPLINAGLSVLCTGGIFLIPYIFSFDPFV